MFKVFSPVGADPGFPVAGGTNPWGRGQTTYDFANFPKNCMKLRECLAIGGTGDAPRSATALHLYLSGVNRMET